MPPSIISDVRTHKVERHPLTNTVVDHGIKAIFFDLHGVLVDTSHWHKVAVLSAMEDILGYVPEPLISNAHPFWGVYGGTLKQLESIHLGAWVSFDKTERQVRRAIYDRKQYYTQQFIKERCRPIPKVIDVMNYAKSIGLRLACVTNGNRVNAEKMVEASGLSKYFEFIIARENVDEKIKPHPLPYLTARYKMNLAHKEALVIDDTLRGIISAVDARCRTWRLKNIDDLSVRNLMRVMSSYRCTL
jgi:HAD superfamily hydrolase (TIGR01509 family)